MFILGIPASINKSFFHISSWVWNRSSFEEETNKPLSLSSCGGNYGLFNDSVFLPIHPLVFVVVDQRLLLGGVIIECKQEQALISSRNPRGLLWVDTCLLVPPQEFLLLLFPPFKFLIQNHDGISSITQEVEAHERLSLATGRKFGGCSTVCLHEPRTASWSNRIKINFLLLLQWLDKQRTLLISSSTATSYSSLKLLFDEMMDFYITRQPTHHKHAVYWGNLHVAVQLRGGGGIRVKTQESPKGKRDSSWHFNYVLFLLSGKQLRVFWINNLSWPWSNCTWDVVVLLGIMRRN